MNEMQKSFIQNGTSFLMHYNHKHDKLGRFAETNGSSRLASKIDKRNEKIDKIDKELSSVRENKKLAKEEYRKERSLNKYDAVETQKSQETHNNSVDKLSRDSNGVLSGNINFGSSDDCRVYINDDSKKSHDLYNKISNDSRFEDEARKYAAEELYGMYRGWDNSWDESSKNNVKEQLKASKDDIYKNTKCVQLQIEDDYDGADILMLYDHKYGPSDYDYERWLVTYNSKKKKFIESQPW